LTTPRPRLVLATFLLFCALLLCRINQDARGVWRLTAPGLSVTALRDTRTGPVLWVTVGGEYRGQWKQSEWYPAEPTPGTMDAPYPTQVPYPTSTPYPTPTRGADLWGA